MAYTKWVTERNKIWERTEGATLAGIYPKKRVVATPNGESTLYTIKKADGELVDLWGTKMIDDFFSNMVIGTDVQIKYLGKKKTAKGGKTYHDFELGWDKDTAPQVATPEKAKEPAFLYKIPLPD